MMPDGVRLRPGGTVGRCASDASTLADQLDVLADRLVLASRNDARVRDIDSVLRSVDRLLTGVVSALTAPIHSGVSADEGMTTASWLRAVARRSGADAGMLLAAAERLAHMLTVAAGSPKGTLSWSAVHGIVAATRNLTAAQRQPHQPADDLPL